jgi:hypothetical protein
VSWDAGPAELSAVARGLADGPDRVALLVLGDGSASRGEKAPGYLDPRAFDVDDAVAAALEKGDGDALVGLDADLARAVMLLGRPALGVLGRAAATVGAPVRARLLHRDDPFGVMYLVALWEW